MHARQGVTHPSESERDIDTEPTWVLRGKGGDVVDFSIDHQPCRGAGAVRRHLSQGESRHAAAAVGGVVGPWGRG